MPATIVIATPEPQKLVRAIKFAVTNKDITTWVVDGEGDFTHGSKVAGKIGVQGQWAGKAYLRPVIGHSVVTVDLILPHGATQFEQGVEGVYVGRFIEMLINHFPDKLVGITVF